jgi:hypothetical protein
MPGGFDLSTILDGIGQNSGLGHSQASALLGILEIDRAHSRCVQSSAQGVASTRCYDSSQCLSLIALIDPPIDSPKDG